ncbi:1-acyl-sn-glycerol-3-phosphate acyltransferase alpha [Orchesella cincta]|uniref:1-acyl-sn-glycerol-3-phosphate acyltransferase n=1 Tax=Orchesella cincta TaxID=48709 RepID=A0A1D2MRM7_ORCCI|nr:1-acyl-sn-glycerol-3-phosphate acyltransferase alpha [Orchesella cincta]
MLSLPGSESVWISAVIGVLLLGIFYYKSPKFRYNVKFAIYIFQMSSVAAFMIPFSIFRPKDVRNIHFGIPLMKLLGRFLGIRWEISGKEILKKDFPCVVISNHQSMLDAMAIVELWPTMYKCACIAKKEILYVFPFGLMCWLCGTIFIDRKNPGQSQMKMSTSAEQIIANKTKIWIFPEGTRSKQENLKPFKKGAFHIALMHKLPIVPIVISPYQFIDDEKKIFGTGTVKAKILDPIDTSNLVYPDDVSNLAERCHELMNLEFQRLKEEMQTLASSKALPALNTRSKGANGHTNSMGDDNGIAFDGKSIS